MIDGQALTLWTIRIAAILYVLAVAGCMARADDRLSRAAWTLGCVFYLAHVASAFHFHHGWSHSAAYRETARQTAELFGAATGSGLYFNYLFTGAWIMDAGWWWISRTGYRRRSGWIAGAVQVFFAFMFFNGAVVFASGPTRWFGLAATVSLGVLWVRSLAQSHL